MVAVGDAVVERTVDTEVAVPAMTDVVMVVL